MTCAQKGMILFRTIVIGYVMLQLAMLGYAMVNIAGMGAGAGVILPLCVGFVGAVLGGFVVLFPVELIYRVHQKTCCCSKGGSSCKVTPPPVE
jgi:hypothetical protein